jgi:excisionase family DNA binding protein
MLTVAQVAQQLGVRESTIRKWVLCRRIRFVKLGRCVRISRAEVDRIIQAGTIPTRKGNQ